MDEDFLPAARNDIFMWKILSQSLGSFQIVHSSTIEENRCADDTEMHFSRAFMCVSFAELDTIPPKGLRVCSSSIYTLACLALN